MKALLLICLIATAHHDVIGGVQFCIRLSFVRATDQNPDISLMQPTHVVYNEAMEFTRFLGEHGINVQSVHRSKMESFFRGITGAAFLKTDRGVLEVIFFQEPTGAENVRVTERRDGEWYIYSFEGQPSPEPNDVINSNRPDYFTMHQNLFIVTRDKELDAALKRVFGQR